MEGIMNNRLIDSLLRGCSYFLILAVALLLQPFDSSAQTQGTNFCNTNNSVKFYMPPMVNGGIDELDTHRIVLGDDFLCTNAGWITAIHLWGSWSNDIVGTITTFYLQIYSDVPPSPTNNYSQPGTLLWQESFAPGQYSSNIYATGQEYFYDPSNGMMGADTTVWQFCFEPTNPFYQTGSTTLPTNYWLVAYASGVPNTNSYGWKTSTRQYNDAAVWASWNDVTELPTGNWTPMVNPITGGQIDLSFELYTVPDPQTNGCVEGTQKYVQLPNLTNGFDVRNNQYSLADDFVCTNTGLVSDLHLWGSWLNDQPLVNSITFWLAIYDDVPPGTGGTSYSHPGNLLWSQIFAPGMYSETPVGFGQESFYDPSPNSPGFGADSQVWYYCFNPTNPLTQMGTVSNPKIYWFMAYAQLPAGIGNESGWKTTGVVTNDSAVYTAWPGNFPPAGWGAPIAIPGVGPVDLAFKLTTQTNTQTNCPIPVTCPTNKTVQCGTSWTFDSPVLGTDPCCPTLTIVTNIPTTNGNCPQVITETWTIYDCLNQSTNCSQVVTVEQTNPPVLTCANSKTVPCGSSWSFDTPTVSNGCFNSNSISLTYMTVTNGVCPLVATRTWMATDPCGNTASCSQTVTLQNTNPPVLTCPGNIVVTSCTATQVTWTVTAYDACSGLTNGVTITSTPASGSPFNPGATTPVTVTAVDACGNSNSCSFTVTVNCVTNVTQCVETNGVKYLQGLNLNGGMDVWNSGPFVVADDFICTNSGPISDIHIWGILEL